MNDQKNHFIWKPDTGITNVESDPDDLGASEIPGIKAVWSDQRERLKGTEQLRKFEEKLNREWAIETGIIENLYDIDRGVTQMLIEHGFKADLLSHGSTNKPKEYVIQILNDQKNAIEGVFAFVKDERNLTTSYIKELHATLLRSQRTVEGVDPHGRAVEVPLIRGAWKEHPNYPERGGVTYRYCPPEHVGSEMDRLCAMHTEHAAAGAPSEVQAAWLHHRFTQIHPFQDGNGRIARAIASLVLIKDGLFPLVVTRDDRDAYLNALRTADEGDLKPLVDLIVKLQIKRFRNAREISEVLEDADAALSGLLRAAEQAGKKKRSSFSEVVKYAHAMESNIYQRLEEVMPTIVESLQKASAGRGFSRKEARASVFQAEQNATDDYYDSQIMENANSHLGYSADFSEYRSWVSLDMYWQHRACKLVFSVHGIGHSFDGVLVCAPFMEFRHKDPDKDGGMHFRLVPVTDEGFIFSYKEDQEKLLSRFRPWREDALKVAFGELARSL